MAPSYAPRPPGERADARRAAGTTGASPPVEVAPLVAGLAGARRSPELVVLEGVHALKHAVRFGADIETVATPDLGELTRLLGELAPDVPLPATTVEVDERRWARLAPRGLPSPALAVARRPTVDVAVLLRPGQGRLVVLEGPRHLGNVGAAIRVAAAAGADGLVIVGTADPWHPTAVRGAAGLQFALPVAQVPTLPPTDRALVAVDPDGVALGHRPLPGDAALVFGTERSGLSEELRRRADLHVAVPMREGVSSLNLATAVGIVLYAG